MPVESARFCHSCGREFSAWSAPKLATGRQGNAEMLLELPPPPAGPANAPSGLIARDESVTFVTAGPVYIENKRWAVHVTTKRILISRTEGLLGQKRSSQEIEPSLIGRISIREEGSILKEYYLELDGLIMKGRKSDLQNLYRAIQSMRNRPASTR